MLSPQKMLERSLLLPGRLPPERGQQSPLRKVGLRLLV